MSRHRFFLSSLLAASHTSSTTLDLTLYQLMLRFYGPSPSFFPFSVPPSLPQGGSKDVAVRMKFEMEGEGAPRRLLVCVAGRKEEGQGPKGWWWCWWVGRCHPDHSCLAPLPCFCPALWRLAALSGRTRPQLLVRECCRVRVLVRAQCMLLIRRSINYESCPFGSHIILCVCIFFFFILSVLPPRKTCLSTREEATVGADGANR